MAANASAANSTDNTFGMFVPPVSAPIQSKPNQSNARATTKRAIN
jgi:hypothetical protein